jgi:hypothetical protein
MRPTIISGLVGRPVCRQLPALRPAGVRPERGVIRALEQCCKKSTSTQSLALAPPPSSVWRRMVGETRARHGEAGISVRDPASIQPLAEIGFDDIEVTKRKFRWWHRCFSEGIWSRAVKSWKRGPESAVEDGIQAGACSSRPNRSRKWVCPVSHGAVVSPMAAGRIRRWIMSIVDAVSIRHMRPWPS